MENIKEPTTRSIEILRGLENPDSWKLATRMFVSEDTTLINEVAEAMDFYHGGHLLNIRYGNPSIGVWTPGYYFYIEGDLDE